MYILRGISTNKDHPTTAPFPARNGFFIEFRGGDLCHPRGNGDWFKPPYFAKVTRFWLSLVDVYLYAFFSTLLMLLFAFNIHTYGGGWWLTFVLLPAPLFNPGIFISWRFGKHGGYIGAKAYGVDSPAYKHWLPANEVYDGSQAIMFSIRPHANLG